MSAQVAPAHKRENLTLDKIFHKMLISEYKKERLTVFAVRRSARFKGLCKCTFKNREECFYGAE